MMSNHHREMKELNRTKAQSDSPSTPKAVKVVRRLARAALIVFGAGICSWLVWHFGQPRYEGWTIREWWREMQQMGAGDVSREEAEATRARFEKAIATLGPRVLPEMASELSDPPSSTMRNRVNSLLAKLPVVEWRLPSRPDYSPYAVASFAVLRSNAAPAVPLLTRLLETENSYRNAAQCLGYIGRAAVPALQQTLQHTNRRVCNATIEALAEIGPDAAAAFPAITNLLAAQDPAIRGAAARAVGAFGPQATNAIPVLASMLQDTNTTLDAAFGLSQIGGSALIPLAQALTNSQRRVQIGAAAALDYDFLLVFRRRSSPEFSWRLLNTTFNLKCLNASFRAHQGNQPSLLITPALRCWLEPDPELKATAWQIFTQLGPEGVVRLESFAASTKAEPMRSAAREVIARLNSKTQTP